MSNEPRYRVGTKLGDTIYDTQDPVYKDQKAIGWFPNREGLAARVVELLNEHGGVGRCGNCGCETLPNQPHTFGSLGSCWSSPR